MSRVYRVEENHLQEILAYTSKSLVGKVLKRFEIIEDKEAIKASAKELIYEEFRNLRKLIESYNAGFSITEFKFKKPEENPT